MNIIICVKQVPGTAKVDIDEKTGVLKRDGVESKLNPYDLYAVEAAVRLKEEYGGRVQAITMGPMQAVSVLKEVLTMGADDGTILSDRSFAGADVLSTSYAISQGIQVMGNYDVIICGKQTTDGDTAQVGPEVAEYLGIPHVSNVTGISLVGEEEMRVEADMGESIQVLDISFPCLITVEKDIFVPRLPSYKRKIETEQQEVTVLTLHDLKDQDKANYGLSGSPTQVERIFAPESSTEKVCVDGSSEEMAEFLYQKLQELKFVSHGR